MTVERFTDEQGRLVERQVVPDALRQVAVARVVSLSPPSVRLQGRRDPVRVAARVVGLTVSVGDFVLIVRAEQGVVAVGKVETI